MRITAAFLIIVFYCSTIVAQTTDTRVLLDTPTSRTAMPLRSRPKNIMDPKDRWAGTTGTRLSTGTLFGVGAGAMIRGPGTTGSRQRIAPPEKRVRPQYTPELDQDGYPKPHIRLLDQ